MAKTSTSFKKGQSANPDGRPKGARNKATLAVEVLLDGEAEGLTRQAVKMALKGDTTALRLCLERICPPRKDRPVVFKMPNTGTPAGLVKGMAAIVSAVAVGELTPGEGQALAALLEIQRKVIESESLEGRVAALEQQQGIGK